MPPPPGKPAKKTSVKKTAVNRPNKVNKLKITSTVFRENIIFIGSEQHYRKAGFWNKMIFIASGFSMADREQLRKADKNTIAFVDEGYTKAEKLPLETLKDERGYNIVSLKSSDDIVKYVNNRPEMSQGGKTGKILLQDVVFFSHGLPGVIPLNFEGDQRVDVTEQGVASMNASSFAADGAIYSYACRTGNSVADTATDLVWPREFKNDEEAHPENSLAQKMADHFKVKVHAFLTRSWYGNVLRDVSDSKRIADTLKEARKSHEGEIIQIPPDHEALPHPRLSPGGWDSGTDEEGTNEYALWRKKGALRLPEAHDTPKGLTRGIRLFTPR